MSRSLVTLVLMFLSAAASAGWQLDPMASHIGFATVKNDVIAENHTFRQFSGHVDEHGMATVSIQLASVETLIPIRNERMQAMLFDVANFPAAIITSKESFADVANIEPGKSEMRDVNVQVSLHGVSVDKTLSVKVTRSSEDSIDVSSLGPIIVPASQFALADGVEALRQVAGLKSIDLMVPVTFSLRFTADDHGH